MLVHDLDQVDSGDDVGVGDGAVLAGDVPDSCRDGELVDGRHWRRRSHGRRRGPARPAGDGRDEKQGDKKKALPHLFGLSSRPIPSVTVVGAT